ncbi:YgaP family membrane protein [Halorhodospira halophila]|uniref:YgaP family membrane protein n=1 Tax=Halorhodospira halophila TaxID=1053 RepID=UPI001912BC56|nr:DUF2892 domain-containing protein [Halorhodospira halophila]MBK5937417.1 hypothetical protein [Halorhodospira halophila]
MDVSRNMGTVDRAIRAVVGICLIALAFIGPQTAWGWIGLFPLATAIVGVCPAYIPLGLKTCAK